MKRTVTFRQIITKTIEIEGNDDNEIRQIVEQFREDDSLIDFEKNFDDIKTDAVFYS